MAEHTALLGQEDDELPMPTADALLQQNSDEQQEMMGTEEPEDDMGELDFTYDDSLLQGEEEEDTAVLTTQQKEQEDQESDRRKKERERNWGPSSANALPAHKSDMPAHSRHSSTDHADRQRGYQKSQRPVQSNRGREPYRGRGSFSQTREELSDQGRRAEGARVPAANSGLVRRQLPAVSSGMGNQYPRPMPPGPRQQEHHEFDPSLLVHMAWMNNAPSFAPVGDDMGHKRKHDQMQAPAGMSAPVHFDPNLLTSDLVLSLHRISQQKQMEQQSQQHQMRPDNHFNGMRPPQHMMGPAIPPPRPPQAPPPPAPMPLVPNSAAMFAGMLPPNFTPLTSKPMDSRPQSGNPQEGPGARPRQAPPAWSLSHGMEGLDRGSNGGEPTLAADMVWDAEGGQNNGSSWDPGASRSEPFRNPAAGQRSGIPGANAYAAGPRVPPPRPPAPAPNKAAELAKSQAALAAAKARFEQQQKENDEIAERNKRQRLGLPEPKPVYQETEIDRLKRQIAEKEAAVKAGQASLPAVIKSAPPSPAKGRAQSVSPTPSSAPGGSTPPSALGSGRSGHRMRSAVAHPESAEVYAEPSDRWRPSEEGHSRSTRGSRERSAREDAPGDHAKLNGSGNSHRRPEHREASRDGSRGGGRDAGHRDRLQSSHHRAQHSSSAQGSGKDQHYDRDTHHQQPKHGEGHPEGRQ